MGNWSGPACYWGLRLSCILLNCKSPTRQSRYGDGARLVKLIEAGPRPPHGTVCRAGGAGR